KSANVCDRTLALAATENIHQLGHLLALLGGVAAGNGVLDAVGHVIAQDLLLDAPERRPHRRDLRDDIDAVAIVLDHAREPSHLAFDAAQALAARCLASGVPR